jgi:hypothetical protein
MGAQLRPRGAFVRLDDGAYGHAIDSIDAECSQRQDHAATDCD